MGILNVTPDSFSDGGRHADPARAIEAAQRMVADGADIVDVGGESTRPGSAPVPPSVEQARILPVVRALAIAGLRVSVDTRNADTMRAALDAGAAIVNDVSGLAHDPAAAPLVAARGCPVVLMHMRGTPATMSKLAVYQDVAAEVRSELAATLARARAAGIAAEAIALDPGIGFAKHAPHSIALLQSLPTLATLGCPLLVGVSRKAFIGALSGVETPADRLAGSIAAGLFAIARGASILRVHDITETAQALRVWHSLSG
ncbi:MAG: dihydropteroate synthase [Rhodospirillales bacterium]|nr:dihydropteroate synthase [Rhodospirillales bacterium]MBN8898152.1 dihydropteroate synthase [Rhodospirillales bacterium]